MLGLFVISESHFVGGLAGWEGRASDACVLKLDYVLG